MAKLSLSVFSQRFVLALSAVALLGAALAPASFAQSRLRGAPIAPQPAAVQPATWATTWAVAPSTASNNPLIVASPAVGGGVTSRQFTNQTIRLMSFASVGGSQVRVSVSNFYGIQALNIGAAHVALRSGTGADIVAATDRTLTFGGQPTISIPAGAIALSDPVSLSVPSLSDVAVSLYLPDTAVPTLTIQPSPHKTSYVALTGTGNVTGAAAFPTLGTTAPAEAYFLTGIEVLAAGAPPRIMAFGDSITEGVGSTTDANASWPNRLSIRLNGQNSIPAAIANVAISGGRLLRDVDGPNGLSRFDRDVLARSNVTHVVNLLGINDIGLPGFMDSPTNVPTAADMIQGYRELIARAHDRGIKIISGTLLPFSTAIEPNYYSASKAAIHDTVNNWIRTSAEFDGMIDFYAVMGDPNDPTALNPAYSSGDGLHPNDLGYQTMANAVDFSLFNGFVTLNSVVSRKVHGNGAGTFDLPLPQGLCTTPAIECRGGGANGAYTLVFSFATPVTSILGAAVAEGTGSVAGATGVAINPNDPSQVTVNLTGVASGQYVTVALTNVSDILGNTSSVRATFGVLVGDTGGNGTVNAADVAQTKSLSGQGVTAANFREDINLDGVINAADVAFVKSRSGTALPTPAPANVNP